MADGKKKNEEQKNQRAQAEKLKSLSQEKDEEKQKEADDKTERVKKALKTKESERDGSAAKAQQ